MALSFHTTSDISNLGIQIQTALVTNVANKDSDPTFEAYKEETLTQIQKNFSADTYKEDPILSGFRDLHTKVGRSNRDYIASPEALLGRFVKSGKFPHINLLVDIYNLQSIASRLALGAHDLRYIAGDISLRLTTGTETFIPLGSPTPVPVFQGEYAYIDDSNEILCRLEVLQVEKTKVTNSTTDAFLIIQGNAQTSDTYVREEAIKLCRLITTYCGGEYELLETQL